MPSSGKLRRLALVRTDVSPILVTLMLEAIRSSDTSVLTTVTWRNIPEDGILHLCRAPNYAILMHLKGCFLKNAITSYGPRHMYMYMYMSMYVYATYKLDPGSGSYNPLEH
jgi:hypothetical protein